MSHVSDVIDRQVAAYNRRDVEAFAARYALGADVYGPDGKILAAGRDQIRRHYGTLFEQRPELRPEIRNRIEVGSTVIDEESVTGFAPDDTTVVRAAVVYRVAEGLILEARLYL